MEVMPARHWDNVGRIVDELTIFEMRWLSAPLIVEMELASASRVARVNRARDAIAFLGLCVLVMVVVCGSRK
jgi:hypothetical protein